MKKNKKKNASAPTKEQEMHKGDVTQEMDAIMEAASEDGAAAESSVLLNAEPATEDTPDGETAEPASVKETDSDAKTETEDRTIPQPCENTPDAETTAAADTEADTQPAAAQTEETDPEKEAAANAAIEPADADMAVDTVSPTESEDTPSPAADSAALDSSTVDSSTANSAEQKEAAAAHSDTEETAETPAGSVSGVSRETSSKETPPADDDTEETEKAPSYKKLGLYLHVPFCRSKCAYCDFYSTDKIVCRGGGRVPEEMKLYTNALKNHMRILSERTTQYNVDTVFIGGGTPTALPAKLLLDIVKEVDRCFYLDDNYEFTVEMNPATADIKLLKKLHRAGVNRLSIGLQSANNHELAALSRIHSVGDFTECFQMAREAGFDNINVDVMYGIPEQTKDSFAETLSFVAAMKPEHISMYNLRIEDGTPFGEKKHMLPLPDEDTECDMYFGGIEYLASQGYHQYEISNFARDGKECRHNLKYWYGEEYLGCGPAAHSYFGGSRFSLRRSLAQYCKALEVKGKSIPSSLLDENYTVDKKEEIAEYLMLRLRLKEGISAEDFSRRFNGDFDAVFGKKLQLYIDRGLMTHENGRYAFTPQGMFVSNYILARIIPFEPKFTAVN